MSQSSLHSTRKPRKPRLGRYRVCCASAALVACFALVGCSTPGGGASGSKGWSLPWSKSAEQKPVTYEQLAKEQRQRKINSPALGLDQSIEPSPMQTAAAALSPSAIGANMKEGADKFASAITPKSNPTSDPKPKSGWPFSKRDEVSADFYVSIAQVHEQGNDNEEAAAQYEKALSVNPKHLDALLGYAHLQDRNGQLGKAVVLYERAVRAHPKDPRPSNDLGLCYAQQTKYNEALACLQKAVKLNPERELYRNNIATVLVKMERVDEAVEQIAVVYGEGVARYNVALMLNSQGSRAAAVEQFAAALKAQPDLTQAQDWLTQLNGPSEQDQLAERPNWSTGQGPVAVASPIGNIDPAHLPQLATPTSATFDASRARNPRECSLRDC